MSKSRPNLVHSIFFTCEMSTLPLGEVNGGKDDHIFVEISKLSHVDKQSPLSYPPVKINSVVLN